MREEKAALRKAYIEIRNAIPKEQLELKSNIIANKVISSVYYKKCQEVFIFISMGTEPQTKEIILDALSKGKAVAAPYAKPKSREMHFIRIESLDNLVKSKYGAYEPLYAEENIVKSGQETLIITPGVVFDKNGYRTGYGGGYYDTYLNNNKYMLSMGIGFEECLCDAVPVNMHDIQLDMLITDARTIRWGH